VLSAVALIDESELVQESTALFSVARLSKEKACATLKKLDIRTKEYVAVRVMVGREAK
jgi:hypothetical protein